MDCCSIICGIIIGLIIVIVLCVRFNKNEGYKKTKSLSSTISKLPMKTKLATLSSRPVQSVQTNNAGKIQTYHPTVASKNSLSTSENKSCPDMFPPGPSEMPPSAYAKIVAPAVLSSAYNTQSSSKFVGYDKVQYACNSPSNLRCTSNDDCAANGIGEICEGPQGNMYCVCESTLKPGISKSPDEKISKNDVIVSYGGACTQDDQCCTNNCSNFPGLLSKICQCPAEQIFNTQTNSCECGLGTHWEEKEADCTNPWPNVENSECYCPQGYVFDSLKGKCVFKHCVLDLPTPPSGACPTVGYSCQTNSDCSLGEECSQDYFVDITKPGDPYSRQPYGYCMCKLGKPVVEGSANKILGGGICTSDDQCSKNTQCIQGTCGCDTTKGLYYDQSDNYCKCVNSQDAFDPITGKCTNSNKLKSVVCPNTYNGTEPEIKSTTMFGLIKGKPCMDDSMCGLGESCDPAHKVCYCNADTHTGKINADGICTSDNQCRFGLCNVDIGNGMKVCSNNDRTPYNVAQYEYPGF